MLKNLVSKIKDFGQILFFFKPEESFKEIFESLNYLDDELSRVYYSSFDIESLYEYFVNKSRLQELEDSLKEFKKIVSEADSDNHKVNGQTTGGIFLFSGLSMASIVLAVVGLNPLVALILFLINFFTAYRLAIISDKIAEVIKKDNKSKKEAQNAILKMEITGGNTLRNLTKRKQLIESKGLKPVDKMSLESKVQEALNSYLDYGSLPFMSDEAIIYLKKMLQEDLGVTEEDLFTLLDLAQMQNLANNLTLEKNLT